MRARFIFSIFLAMLLAYPTASHAQFGDLLKKDYKDVGSAVNKGQSKNKESDEASNNGRTRLKAIA